MNHTIPDDLAEDPVLADVRTWTGPGPLVRFVLEAVSSFSRPDSAPALRAVSRLSNAVAQGQSPVAQQPMVAPANRAGCSSDFGSAQRVMLSLLTYSYACGLYSSEEIERAIQRVPALRYLSAGLRPDSAQIRWFRRRHRRALTKCLGRTLALAWQRRLDAELNAGFQTRTESLTCPAPRAFWWPWTHATPSCLLEPGRLGEVSWRNQPLALETFCSKLAAQRIDQAVWLDSMALDD